MELSSTQIFNVEKTGAYQLTVSRTLNGVICEKTVEFDVLSSGGPEQMEVETKGFSDRIDLRVSATGTGPFQYSLDGEIYQSSNEFKVFPGKYRVYVKDDMSCRVLSQEVVAIGYQRFFTPNGDSTNEYWNIIGAELFPNASLSIFDRYGMLLKQVSQGSKGWDGTFNGVPLPESDYWFRYSYAQDKVITGHFTLKR